jgi:signal transduction histidine kinase
MSEALQELRDLSQGIHPGILTERGLPAALSELTQRIEHSVALEVHLTERLPDRVEEAAYFVVCEALTNVMKHAHATRAFVQIECRDDIAVLRVADDGVGGAAVHRGTGLRGLQDRVEALGGQLSVESPPAMGTTLEALIPCAW